jgi:hypothetical protein
MAVTLNASTSNGLIQTADTSGILNLQSNGTTMLSVTSTGPTLVAGTTTIAPLDFAAGTLLTTAIAGGVEYNGTALFFTPTSTQRGVIPTSQYYRLNSAVVGANATGAQSLFGVGVTLSASTVYEFEAIIALSKTAGTTSHTIAIGFGGTATLNNIGYMIISANDSSFTSVSTNTSEFVQTAAATVQTGAITTASRVVYSNIKGTVSINAGGTFIPQYTLSAAPGGAYTTQIGNYFKITPLSASGANTSIGIWA